MISACKVDINSLQQIGSNLDSQIFTSPNETVAHRHYSFGKQGLIEEDMCLKMRIGLFQF